MFYKKQGLPEEGELVLCTVTSIQYHSVFVKIDSYDKTAMIHISEISPGRIRNLNDYVTVGKKIVCKVIRLDKVKGHVDLSLRRVNEGQRRIVTNQIKKEQKAEKIIEFLAKETKQKAEDLYKKISQVALQDYEYLHECFEDIVAEEFSIKDFKLPDATEKAMGKLIEERMQPPTYEIKGKLSLKTFDSKGVQVIKDTFKKLEDPKMKINYLGAGTYNIMISSQDVEEANELKSKVIEVMEDFKEKHGEANFQEV